jgi:hypothetical protein
VAQKCLTVTLENFDRVCRPEQYRVRYILYRSLLQRTAQLRALASDYEDPPFSQGPLSSLLVYARRPESFIPQLTNHRGHERDETISRLALDLLQLIELFDSVLYEEYSDLHTHLPTIFPPAPVSLTAHSSELSDTFSRRSSLKRRPKPSPKIHANISAEEQVGNFSCDFCGADIFQSFFECRQCRPVVEGSTSGHNLATQWQYGDGLLVCAHCYIEGRTCNCGSMYPVQCRPFKDLLRDRNEAVHVLRNIDHDSEDRRVSLLEE